MSKIKSKVKGGIRGNWLIQRRKQRLPPFKFSQIYIVSGSEKIRHYQLRRHNRNCICSSFSLLILSPVADWHCRMISIKVNALPHFLGFAASYVTPVFVVQPQWCYRRNCPCLDAWKSSLDNLDVYLTGNCFC